LKSNPLWFKETLISFNITNNGAIGRGSQSSTVLREMLTKLFVRSYLQQIKLWFIFSHFC